MTRVILQPLEARHLARTFAWANDADLMRLLNRASPVSEAEHAEWFGRISSSDTCAYFAIETGSGEHVGNVWLWDIDRWHQRAEVRIVMALHQTDRGLGSLALDLVARRAFEQLQLHKVYAYVLEFNERARRSFEKAGFRVEGRLRSDRRSGDRWVDVYLLGRLSDDAISDDVREGRV